MSVTSDEKKFQRSKSFKIEAEVEKFRGVGPKLDKSVSMSQFPLLTPPTCRGVSSVKSFEDNIQKVIQYQDRCERREMYRDRSSTFYQYDTSVTMRYDLNPA